jgi:hypothetical protein
MQSGRHHWVGRGTGSNRSGHFRQPFVIFPEDLMHKFIIKLTILLVFSPAITLADDYDVLRNFKTVLWPQAYRTQDVELLDRLLHDSFEMIDGEGIRSTKEKELEYISNNQWDPGSFEYQIERLQIYQGAFAVIDGTGVAENYTYKSSNFLIKEDGVWRAIASHVSGYQSTSDAEH